MMESVNKGVLATDLYEQAMLQGYFSSGMNDTAVLDFFARELPSAVVIWSHVTGVSA